MPERKSGFFVQIKMDYNFDPRHPLCILRITILIPTQIWAQKTVFAQALL